MTLDPTQPSHRSRSLLREFLRQEASGGIVLMACAVIALVVANSPLAGAYFGMLHVHVATCVDRLAGDGGHTVSIEVDEVDTKRLHRVDVQDDKGASPT